MSEPVLGRTTPHAPNAPNPPNPLAWGAVETHMTPLPRAESLRTQGDLSIGVSTLRAMRAALAHAAEQPGCADLVDGIGQSPRHLAQLLRAFRLTYVVADLGADAMGLVSYDLRLFFLNERYLHYRPYYTGASGIALPTEQNHSQRQFMEYYLLATLFAFWMTEPRRLDVAVMPAIWWQGDTLQAAIWRGCLMAAGTLWMPHHTVIERLDAARRVRGAGTHELRAAVERLARQYNTSPHYLWERYNALCAARDQWRADHPRIDPLERAERSDSFDCYITREIQRIWTQPGFEHMFRVWAAHARADAFVAFTNEETTHLPYLRTDPPTSGQPPF